MHCTGPAVGGHGGRPGGAAEEEPARVGCSRRTLVKGDLGSDPQLEPRPTGT